MYLFANIYLFNELHKITNKYVLSIAFRPILSPKLSKAIQTKARRAFKTNDNEIKSLEAP